MRELKKEHDWKTGELHSMYKNLVVNYRYFTLPLLQAVFLFGMPYCR